jgi:hypothetical protein
LDRSKAAEKELATHRASEAERLAAARAERDAHWQQRFELLRAGIDDDDGAALVAQAWERQPKDGRGKTPAEWWAKVAADAAAGKETPQLSKALAAYLPSPAPAPAPRGTTKAAPAPAPAPRGAEVRGGGALLEFDPKTGFAGLLGAQLGALRR